MHFAAWASVGDSVRDPVGYYRNNVTGTLAVLEAMAAEHVPSSCSRRPPRSSAIRSRRRSPKTIRRTRSTPTAKQSSRSSARCRTSSAPTGSGRRSCATSTPPAPIRMASWARTIRPSLHLIPRAHRRRGRPGYVPDLRRRLPDAGRHLPSRLHPRHRSGRRAPACAGRPPRRGRRPPTTTSATASRHLYGRSSTPSGGSSGRRSR